MKYRSFIMTSRNDTETDEAYAMLERGREGIRNGTRAKRSQWVHDARLSPFLASLRGDRRWDAVVAWED